MILYKQKTFKLKQNFQSNVSQKSSKITIESISCRPSTTWHEIDDLPLSVVCIPNETPLEKTNFSIVIINWR